jgi:hypothetical protein
VALLPETAPEIYSDARGGTAEIVEEGGKGRNIPVRSGT